MKAPKYVKFENQPKDHILTFCDYLDFAPVTQKLTHPTNGTFQYVESHAVYYVLKFEHNYAD